MGRSQIKILPNSRRYPHLSRSVLIPVTTQCGGHAYMCTPASVATSRGIVYCNQGVECGLIFKIQNTNVPQYKQNKIQRQNTNESKYLHDKMQKFQNTNTTKYKRTKYKLPTYKRNKIQFKQNTNGTKYK